MTNSMTYSDKETTKITSKEIKSKEENDVGNDVILRLEDVWKIYKMGEVEVSALRGVSIEIKKGDFVAIIGASGSGKSTMMNLIGCLDIPSRGNVYLKSQDISKLSESDLASVRGRTIGFIFQQYNLIQSIHAFDNVKLPLEFLEFSLKKALKKGGRLVIVENVVTPPSVVGYFGPRLTKELIIAQLKYYGFYLVGFKQFVPHRYVLIFKKD